VWALVGVVICRRCGTESPEGFRFCPACGGPLAEAVAQRQARKVVTALFCDVTGSTALGEELDPEVFRGVLNRYFAEIRAVIERHGGTVDKFQGDSVMAVFGIPQVQEDDALRAVRAAAEIRERLPALAQESGVELRFRTGVNTGPVLMSEGENLVVGDAVNVAARLEQAAAPGEIVLSSETLRLVRDAVEVEPLEALALKGKSEPVAAFRLVGVDPVAPGFARHLDAPLIGREPELHLLHEAWDRVVRERGCHLFTLLGAAGVGKSRLVAELLAGVGETATVLRGRCLHYGDGITFWPLIEALIALEDRAGLVLERLDTGGAAVPEELFWEVRRLLEALALERPVILYVDDLQWAQPMLLDLLDHVVDLSRGAPILLLCAARPELLEDRPGWGGGKLNASAVLLEPLDAAESERLLAGLGDGLEADARARVVAASEGNPLFLEEMVALARERGTVAVPSTIQALLAARIERLAVDEREVLERGAVEGEVFHRLAVRALAGEGLSTGVELRLSGLVRKELIRPHPPTFLGDEAFRFRHLLIRDAAYDGLPKSQRAELHERFARWLERAGGELRELDEIAGWHLEQAVVYQRELGRAPDPALVREAAVHLHAAGRRAGARGDSSAAQNLLERAVALAPAEEALGAQIAVDLAEQLLDSGELARADGLLSAVEQDPEVAGLGALTRFEWLITARPQEATETIESQLPVMLEQLTRAGDHRALAKAHIAAWWAHWVAGRATAAGEEAGLAATHANAAGDEGLRSRAVAAYLSTLMFGRPHATQIAQELDAIEREDHGPYLAAAIRRDRGSLCALEGRFAEAIELTRLAIDDLNALGLPMRAAACHQRLADIQFSAGNPAGAIEALQPADETLAQQGERTYRSTMQAYLAEAYELLHDPAAARAAIELAEQLSAPDDALNYAITDGVRARLALSDGDGDAAERWARSAVQHTLKTDFLVDEARARLNLAHVLSALGQCEPAAREAQTALELYETKGDLPGATRARALL
jgi:class 3 adenylate cyclase/tetratricopeptide (TPR) repeat protein